MKRFFSDLLIISVLLFMTGCSKMNYEDLKKVDITVITPQAGTAEVPGTFTVEDTKTEGGSNTEAVPTMVDEALPTPTGLELPADASDITAPTEAPTEAPTPTLAAHATYKGSREIPANITDVKEMCEYLRNQIVINADYYDSLDNSNEQTWCFKRMKDHTPSGTYETFRIKDYNSCYYDDTVADDDKVIYLTFDCGYPSDRTERILDILKKHDAKANFFVTKMYIEKCADYCIRMKEEGHAVCNHTVSHTDLRYKSVEKIAAEIFDCAEYFYDMTGYEFDPYFRTPSGAYTKKLLTIINDAGYKTVFWSIAYGDYDSKNQPAPGYVTDHFATYHHNGAIALMHNDSESNVNELDAVLTLLENEGYRFALLSELD